MGSGAGSYAFPECIFYRPAACSIGENPGTRAGREQAAARHGAVDDVLRVCRRIFAPEWLNLAIIAPELDDALQARLRFSG